MSKITGINYHIKRYIKIKTFMSSFVIIKLSQKNKKGDINV
jgi:hypothetical protein